MNPKVFCVLGRTNFTTVIVYNTDWNIWLQELFLTFIFVDVAIGNTRSNGMESNFVSDLKCICIVKLILRRALGVDTYELHCENRGNLV